MKKILSVDIIDIIPYGQGILFVRKEALDDENIKVTFFSYDLATDSISPVSRNVYLLNKFGSCYDLIASQLGDYASCEAGILGDNGTFVIYSSGEVGVFNNKGTLMWTGDLMYHDAPALGVAVENNHIWSCVSTRNCIIRYSLAANKVVMRIGSESSDTFCTPVSITEDDNKLYVCNKDANKVNVVNLKDFTVADYLNFDEPVHKFIKVNGREFVVLESGVYLID
ncbi:MAG TPA: hypothetical protein GXZ23_07350 [Clostridiales bacterium]|jgi:hypothetical protein|nr:hypothetical protein [Clostridiales bacterium]